MLIYRPRNALHDNVIIAVVESEENDLLYVRASNSYCEWDRECPHDRANQLDARTRLPRLKLRSVVLLTSI